METKYLEKYFNLNQEDKKLQKISASLTKKFNTRKLNELYADAINSIEDNIWQHDITDAVIADYQALFREYETHIENNDDNKSRYKFIIVIPVADRPQHLKTCLNSILTLCEKYRYGGTTKGTFNKVCVLISDDSQHANNIKKHNEMATSFRKLGLECIYFGEHEQKKILSTVDSDIVKNMTGDIDCNNFYHKGASVTRNISYLKLLQLQNQNQPCLFYFIDSDQEFKINISTPEGSKNTYAINYFYHLNKIFLQNNISILTGKVVGDPPVSPAVMAGTFIDDVITFTKQISKLKPGQTCQFHNTDKNNTRDAAYHDMAELFGFKTQSKPYDYHCTLKHKHTNTECLTDFSRKLNHFFDGEHPTRKSYYQYENINNSIKPARTIYTGNYIFKPENLKYFIPFPNLKLRMAGPVLGRIIQAELGEQFVSANLPMLHNRTVDNIGQSEFRPGVNHQQNSIDLSGEFTRQFYGDVMLFSIIKLTELGFPKKSFSLEDIKKTVYQQFISMQSKYTSNQQDISNKIISLKKARQYSDKNFKASSTSNMIIKNFENFIDNIEFNFGKNALAYKLINSQSDIDANLHKISIAISTYNNDRSNWQKTLSISATI